MVKFYQRQTRMIFDLDLEEKLKKKKLHCYGLLETFPKEDRGTYSNIIAVDHLATQVARVSVDKVMTYHSWTIAVHLTKSA